MTTHFWVVVPCCREEQLRSVWENYRRQTYRYKRLCIVENGLAVGGCRRLGFRPDLVIASRSNVSHARNEGMFAVREFKDDAWVAMWDDDDWYGPHYLEEAALLTLTGKAQIYGKLRHFVTFQDRRMFLFGAVHQHSYVPAVHGPSLVFRPSEAVAFRPSKEAEEISWCNAMRALGARVWASSVHHLLYVRHGGSHAWQASDELVKAASAAGDIVYEFEAADLTVVTGAVDWASRVKKHHGARTFRARPWQAPERPAWVSVAPREAL